MENKPQSLLEKVDNQGKQIDDISQRLEGISINDMYALAKRTLDYGDYQTAQKYYNHISFLKPLDWEAPLYASLCNFKGYHDMFFWTKVPEQVERIIISTIKYIYGLDMDDVKKENEMSRCIEIIKYEMLKTKEHYFKHKSNYDEEDSDYIYILEDYFLNVRNEIKDIDLNSIKEFIIVLAEEVLSLIEATKKISRNITREVFDELTNSSKKKIDTNFDSLFDKHEESHEVKKDLSLEDIKIIKLNGIMYFEYNDKVIAKRISKSNILFGTLITLSSIGGLIISMLGKWYWIFIFLLPFLYGISLIVKGIVQRNKIKCASILNMKREKNRLTSNGNVVLESRFSFMRFLVLIMLYILLLLGTLMFIFAITEKVTVYIWAYLIIGIVECIFITISLKAVAENRSIYNGKYSYYYKGKFYKLD